MSRIFDALRLFEAERSGVQSLAVETPAQELLRGAEKELGDPVKLPSTSPCLKCTAPVPDDSLFCPKCDSYQGPSTNGECFDLP